MDNNRRDLCDRTFQFALRIVKLSNELSKSPGVGRTIANQLLRSGTSVGANVEEGQGAQSEADFVAKYSIARKEARETHYWLRLLAESKTVPPAKLTELITASDELIAILTSIVKKIQTRRAK
jgi:four helix bundle protein